MQRDVSQNYLPIGASLREVLSLLNQGVHGIVLLVDDNNKLQGIFTDGDVRRAFLKGAQLDDAAWDFMNKDFSHGSLDNTKESNLKLLNHRIRHLPILDKKGVPRDLISFAELWKMPLTTPSFGGNELKYVTDCITSSWISSQGPYIEKFQEAFKHFLGSPYALSTSSCTTALHLSLIALGVSPGDEVIVPNLTFAAPANTVLHLGAKVVLVDVAKDTWTLDPDLLEASITPKTKAIIAVHLYGHPCDMDPIMQIAKRHGIFVIEDCAESLGAKYKDKYTGTLGDIACFSFFANKVITTGEGGMIVTRHQDFHQRMHLLRDHGMDPKKRYWHLEAGYNYRMTSMQAAVGLAQMEQIDSFFEHKKHIVRTYQELLSEVPGITLPPQASWAHNIYWLYSILIDTKKIGVSRDCFMDKLTEFGIETRPLFYPLHQQDPYAQTPNRDFSVSESLAENGISLPTANNMALGEIEKVCHILRKVIRNQTLIHTYCYGKKEKQSEFCSSQSLNE